MDPNIESHDLFLITKSFLLKARVIISKIVGKGQVMPLFSQDSRSI
ncbi:hypothetical protein ASZ90_014217 [hydrocarbon metagenome]|uniref:Uncharacterized protein n=1 Tax=hydrocarbon metagenome TaxID=938273 RepID=A0A0W8F5H0_9ZZZZ